MPGTMVSGRLKLSTFCLVIAKEECDEKIETQNIFSNTRWCLYVVFGEMFIQVFGPFKKNQVISCFCYLIVGGFVFVKNFIVFN